MKSPAKFVREVKNEGAKVSWPTKKEVWIACLMVVVITAFFALFFFVVDWAISSAVAALLKF